MRFVSPVYRSLAAVAAVLAFARPSSAGELSTGLLYHSNLSRASASGDEESDTFWLAGMAHGRQWLPARDWRLDASLSAASEVAFEFSDFNQLALGAESGATYKWGLGPQAPRFRVGVALAQQWFDDADRSRWALRPSLQAFKRVHDRVELEAFYHFDQEEAREDLHSSDAHTLGLGGMVEVGDRWTLHASYRYRDGDVVSYSENPPDYLMELADRSDMDADTFGRPLTAYRIEAQSHSIELGFVCQLSSAVHAGASYGWTQTERGPLSYDMSVVQFSVGAQY